MQRRPERAEVLFGVGDSLGAGSPFGMLGRAIRRAAGIQEGEPLDEKRRKLAERVARHVDREVVPRVAAFLGEIANVPFPDDDNEALQAARARTRSSWATACAGPGKTGWPPSARRSPVLIVLEDLHWGDLGTVSFIDAALRNLREQPLMVLALARPDVSTRAFPSCGRTASCRPSACRRCRAGPARSWCARRWGPTSRRRSSGRSSSAPTATPSTWKS